MCSVGTNPTESQSWLLHYHVVVPNESNCVSEFSFFFLLILHTWFSLFRARETFLRQIGLSETEDSTWAILSEDDEEVFICFGGSYSFSNLFIEVQDYSGRLLFRHHQWIRPHLPFGSASNIGALLASLLVFFEHQCVFYSLFENFRMCLSYECISLCFIFSSGQRRPVRRLGCISINAYEGSSTAFSSIVKANLNYPGNCFSCLLLI